MQAELNWYVGAGVGAERIHLYPLELESNLSYCSGAPGEYPREGSPPLGVPVKGGSLGTATNRRHRQEIWLAGCAHSPRVNPACM